MADTKDDEFSDVDRHAVNTIRVLAADMVQKANSGHPGMPMGMAPAAHVLWTRHMSCNPANSSWPNRDRFVLSNGHGCALLYSMLHLSGYKISMDDLKQFRQLLSITPGHPENFMTDGVEVSTGPLGQGIAQAVGMALASRYLGARFNKPGFDVINHKTWVFCGDGCLMEGISHEVTSLAGHWALKDLVLVYDDNHISIDGHTDLAFTDDTEGRFKSMGWNVLTIKDGNSDLDGICRALDEARLSTKPVMIMLKTIIGYGSTKEDTHGVHGAPLGNESLEAYKKKMGLEPGKTFVVADKVYEMYKQRVGASGAKREEAWTLMMKKYAAQYPDDAKEFWRVVNKELPVGWDADIPKYDENSPKKATRNLGGDVLNAIAPHLTELMGGSADLSPSTKTKLKCTGDFTKDSPNNRHIRWGVREFGMFAISNGISAYGLIPFSATFLNFITYGFGAVRLGALSHLQQIYVMTHDSIFLGEDGPTHQPVEVLPLLRATPNLTVWRPADGSEVAAAWKYAIQRRDGPTVICLTRQGLPPVVGSCAEQANKGAYIVVGCKEPEVVLIGTGSEVATCVDAAKLLEKEGVRSNVVSCPSMELFEAQPQKYKQFVLPTGVPVVSVEASSSMGWSKYSHHQIAVDRFGVSAPLKDVAKYFGFTPEQVFETVLKFIKSE